VVHGQEHRLQRDDGEQQGPESVEHVRSIGRRPGCASCLTAGLSTV
jgi:hypothetical protein